MVAISITLCAPALPRTPTLLKTGSTVLCRARLISLPFLLFCLSV